MRTRNKFSQSRIQYRQKTCLSNNTLLPVLKTLGPLPHASHGDHIRATNLFVLVGSPDLEDGCPDVLDFLYFCNVFWLVEPRCIQIAQHLHIQDGSLSAGWVAAVTYEHSHLQQIQRSYVMMRSIFWNAFTTDIIYLAREGQLYGVFCELKMFLL